jgi:predicted restriction endonuclease
MTNSDRWLHKLARLRVDKARGDAAPHKPLLLLVVFDLGVTGRPLPSNRKT